MNGQTGQEKRPVLIPVWLGQLRDGFLEGWLLVRGIRVKPTTGFQEKLEAS